MLVAVERHVQNDIKCRSHAKHIFTTLNMDIEYGKTYLLRNFIKNFLRYCKLFTHYQICIFILVERRYTFICSEKEGFSCSFMELLRA